MKRLLLYCVLLLLIGAIGAAAQEEPASPAQPGGGPLFGLYTDIDAKEAGPDNWTVLIGWSQPVGKNFYLVGTGEKGKFEFGDEYAGNGYVLYMFNEGPIHTFWSRLHVFALIGFDVTGLDFDPALISSDEFRTYILAASGGGLTFDVDPKMRVWLALENKQNGDFATTRFGVGFRYSLL